jgi:hypothetical protein
MSRKFRELVNNTVVDFRLQTSILESLDKFLKHESLSDIDRKNMESLKTLVSNKVLLLKNGIR